MAPLLIAWGGALSAGGSQLATWTGASPCSGATTSSWTGVTCAGGMPTVLNLANKGLSGSITCDVANVTTLLSVDVSRNARRAQPKQVHLPQLRRVLGQQRLRQRLVAVARDAARQRGARLAALPLGGRHQRRCGCRPRQRAESRGRRHAAQRLPRDEPRSSFSPFFLPLTPIWRAREPLSQAPR